MTLHHKDCGGEIQVHTERPPYEYDDEEGHHGLYPVYVCALCGTEITGDGMIAESIEDIQNGLYEKVERKM